MPVQDELHPGEYILSIIDTHYVRYFWWYVLIVVLYLISIGFILSFGAYLLIPAIYLTIHMEVIRRSNKYVITNKRVFHVYRLFHKKTSSIIYNRIQHIDFHQTLYERPFNVGDIHLSSSGTQDTEMMMIAIKNPLNVKKRIEQHMMTAKV